jgi:large subunit ribosomal protein L10
MPRPEKVEQVELLTEKLRNAHVAVLTDYRGLSVGQLQDLRGRLRAQDVEYRVVKNTLVRHAIKHHGWAKNLDTSLVGMTGVAWSYEDPSAAAKVVKAFRKDHEKLKVKAGLIEGQVLPGDAVETQLATMPGKNELRAMLLATMQAPLTNFLQLLNAPAQNFAYLLKAKEDKANEGSPAT